MTKQQEFIDKMAVHAKTVQEKYGVPASIAIAQAALETGWGENVKGNNFFGIKTGKLWDGAKIEHATHEFINGVRVRIEDTFRAYDSLQESAMNYGLFLTNNRRYRGVVDARNGYEAADALQQSGYATDPNYAIKLKSIIAKYNLTQFDEETYKGYANTDDGVQKQAKTLEQKREQDPSVWNDFMGFIYALFAVVATKTLYASGNDHELSSGALPPAPTTPAIKTGKPEKIPSRNA